MCAMNSFRMCRKIFVWLLIYVSVTRNTNAQIAYKSTCTEERLIVEVEKPDYESDIYLENMKYYPEMDCHPTLDASNTAVFNLSLTNFAACGITRIANQITGVESFYQRIVVEGTNDVENRSIINVKCTLPSKQTMRNITRRDVSPDEFTEQDDIEITTTIENNAPEPILKVAVKQGDKIVDGELVVQPGAPLTMEIYLDRESAPIYGLLVSFMRCSDTKSQEETMIFNGCSVDPFIFQNFETVDGDNLTTKFRAFKFPETNYIQFTGTVNVCLDKCKGVQCSNGQIGYGRRKREIHGGIPYDAKKVFEVTLTTYVKVTPVEQNLKYKEYADNVIAKRYAQQNYKTLHLNESDVISLDDLIEKNTAKIRDEFDGNHTRIKAINEDDDVRVRTNDSRLLKLNSIFYLLLTTLTVLISSNRIFQALKL